MTDEKYSSYNLTRLEEMFPDKLVLDVDDIVKATCISKSKIYKLSSLKQLPFKLLEIDGRIRASIYEVAMYLDGITKIEQYVPTFDEEPEIAPVIPEPPVKKVGRPRKIDSVINQSSIVRRFQDELKEEIIKQSIKENLNNIFDKLSSASFADNEGELDKKEVDDFISSSKLKVVEAMSNLRETFLGFKMIDKDDEGIVDTGRKRI